MSVKAPMPRSLKEMTDIIRSVAREHQPSATNIALINRPACKTCDEISPCKISRLAGVALYLQEERERIWHALNTIPDLKEQAEVVHASWLAAMQEQYREVKPEYQRWDALPERDRTLDFQIWQTCAKVVRALLSNRYGLFMDKVKG